MGSFFVYGSLRPDDDSGMPWTKRAVRGFKFAKAHIYGYTMFDYQYASVRRNTAKDEEGSSVLGYVLTVDSSVLAEENISEAEFLEAKLNEFDSIEGYVPGCKDSLYERCVCNAFIIADGKVVKCWIYLRNNIDENVARKIPEGDWLQ